MQLELKDISVSLSGKKILKSINLRVSDGEFISLLGASGCGKSTMLKTIAGIIPQESGSVLLGKKSVDKLPPHRRKTVIVFQDFRIFPHMDVIENIAFPLKMAGESKNKRLMKSKVLLKKVKLEGFENRYAHEMSGGQIQRVALARALAAEPKVLLLDEPFSSLDVNLRKEMRELVLELQKEYRITAVLVTHDQEEALTMSDRIAFMDQGRIEQYDTPENLFENPVNTLVADYFSDGVYVKGEIKNKEFISPPYRFSVSRPDGSYKCLIRPSAVKVRKYEEGNFKIERRIYKGENYLIKLSHKDSDLKMEAVIPKDMELAEGNRADIELDKDHLVFIKEQ